MPRLGPKAFEQAAGFLRISDGENPLDASAVHPERYAIVEGFAKQVGRSVKDLMENENLRKKIRLEDFINEEVGLPTLTDIMSELAKPGRDPRAEFESFSFAGEINQRRCKARYERARHRNQRDEFRSICRYRGPSGRSGSHKSAGGSFC